MIIGILAVGAAMAFLSGWLARRNGRAVWWGIVGSATAVLLLWAVGSAWIFSSFCRDVQTCDSGGWLAFSALMAVVLLLVLIGASVGCVAVRLLQK